MAMTLRLDEETRARARVAAERERISMHALIQRAVDRELARLEKAALVGSIVDQIREEDRDLLDRLGR